MEAGENMMYGVQVLDGCVHDECGTALLTYLKKNVPEKGVDAVGQIIRCPEGNAVSSPTFGSLVPYFGSIIHTVSPFQSDAEWETKVSQHLSYYDVSTQADWGHFPANFPLNNLSRLTLI